MPNKVNEKNYPNGVSNQGTPAFPPGSSSHPPCVTYSKAKRDFLRAFPQFAATESTTGRVFKKEYATLLGGRSTYADYGGAGQPMASVLRRFHEYQRINILGNPHSENSSSSRSSRAEQHAREVALRFVGADPGKYACVWTANASGALGLIRQHYPRPAENLAVVLTEDIHNSMNGIRTALSENGRFTVVPVDIMTLRVDEKTFRVSDNVRILSKVDRICRKRHPSSLRMSAVSSYSRPNSTFPVSSTATPHFSATQNGTAGIRYSTSRLFYQLLLSASRITQKSMRLSSAGIKSSAGPRSDR